MENLCSSKSEEEVFGTIVKLVATLFALVKHSQLEQIEKSRDRKNKKKNHQGQQVGRLKKPEIRKSGTNSQHITTGISKVA